MMMSSVKSLYTFVLIGALTLVSTGGAWADDDDDDDVNEIPGHSIPLTINVDCVAGDTIAGAVDAVLPGVETRIVLQSDCIEDVTIRKDGITLDGDPTGSGLQGGSATLIGSVQFEDAHRAAVRNLTVSSPSGDGVIATAGATVTVENSVIANNEFVGVLVEDGANGTIRNNEISDNGEIGILVISGAYARVEYNVIERNGLESEGIGIAVMWGAVVRANGNRIVGNGSDAELLVDQNATYRSGVADIPEIIGDGNTSTAITVKKNSSVAIRFVEVTGQISVTPLSYLEIRGTSAVSSRVISDFRVFDLSSVRLIRNVDATGSTILCQFPSVCSCSPSSNICPAPVGPPPPG